MYIKIFWILIFLIIWGFGKGFSQTTDTAKKEFVPFKAIEKYIQNVKITFQTKTYWAAFEEWMTSKGILEVSGEKYRLKTKEMEWLSNGNILWVYSHENNQVVIYSAEGRAAPSKILLDFLKAKALSVEMVPDGIKVFLETKGALEQYSKVEMLLEKKSYIPKKIQTWDSEENQTIYMIESFKSPVIFPKDYFIFSLDEYKKKYSELEVIYTIEE